MDDNDLPATISTRPMGSMRMVKIIMKIMSIIRIILPIMRMTMMIMTFQQP